MPPFGIIELDTGTICDIDRLSVSVYVDMPTGLGTLTIKAEPHGGGGDALLLHRIEAQVGIPITMSQVTRDFIGGVTSILSSVTSVAAMAATGGGAALLGAGATAVSGIGNAVQALTPRAQTIGSGGAYAQLGVNQQVHGLYSEFYEVVDDDIDQHGRPLCKVIKPKDAAGYYLIQDGDVAIDGTREEASQVRAYLESGFYYE